MLDLQSSETLIDKPEKARLISFWLLIYACCVTQKKKLAYYDY